MSDPLGKITEGKDLIGKIRNFLSGFTGYLDRENRREADKLLRQTIAQRYEEQWDRISQLQRHLISDGKLELVDDVEAAGIKLRAFIDRSRDASYGYSGFFDAVRVNEAELKRIYEFDTALLDVRLRDLGPQAREGLGEGGRGGRTGRSPLIPTRATRAKRGTSTDHMGTGKGRPCQASPYRRRC